MRMHKKQRSRGVAVIEFAFSLSFLIPLLLGAFVFGFRLIHSLEMEQIVRDLGHMYVRGVDFRNPGPQANARTLASSFDLSANGTSLVILSKVRVVTQADCDANNAAPGTHCTNLGNPVFVEQMTIGNTSLTSAGENIAYSVFGTPPLQADNTVRSADQANNSAAAANGFSNTMTLNPGEYAFVVEMRNATPDLNIPGLSGSPQVYARSIF